MWQEDAKKKKNAFYTSWLEGDVGTLGSFSISREVKAGFALALSGSGWRVLPMGGHTVYGADAFPAADVGAIRGDGIANALQRTCTQAKPWASGCNKTPGVPVA